MGNSAPRGGYRRPNDGLASKDYLEMQLSKMSKLHLLAKAESVQVDEKVIEQCVNENGTDRLINAIMAKTDATERGEDLTAEIEAESRHAAEENEKNQLVWYLKAVPPFIKRVNSMEVVNDPRNFGESIIDKRFVAFESITIGAMVLASMAISAIVNVKEDDDSWIKFYMAVVSLVFIFVMNLFTVAILTQQHYMVTRLGSSGSHGFEMSKSFYLNDNITKLRHFAVQCFVFSLPLLMLACSLLLLEKMGPFADTTSIVIASLVAVATLLTVLSILKQRSLFSHYSGDGKRFLEQMNYKMNLVNMRTKDKDRYGD